VLAHSHVCPECRVKLSAADPFTLRWGVETHVCSVDLPGVALVDWLVGVYGRSFWLVRRSGSGRLAA